MNGPLNFFKIEYISDEFEETWYVCLFLFTRCWQILKTVKNVTDGPPVHTKAGHLYRQILKAVDFENGTLTGTFWKRHQVNTRK